MARNSVHAGDRIEIVSFAADHNAGDLVFEQGWFGVVEETVKTGKRGYLIPNYAWKLPRTPATVAAGTKLYAIPTAIATALQLVSVQTGAYVAVGRTLATGNASVADVRLFHPNDQY